MNFLLDTKYTKDEPMTLMHSIVKKNRKKYDLLDLQVYMIWSMK